MRRAAVLGTAAAVMALVGVRCASAPTASVAAPSCQGLTPPRLLVAGPSALPPTYTAARLGAEVTEEVVVSRDGTVGAGQARLVATAVGPLAPFARAALEKARFSPGTIEGNPVAVRGVITIPIGTPTKLRSEPSYDSLRTFVAAGTSREARWQLAGSVERLTLVAHVGSAAAAGGASIVAVAPAGAEKLLLTIPASPPPVEVRETVKTGRFFHDAGDYALKLRAGGKILAETTLTIAPGFESAVVNACEPLSGLERTGPGQ